MEDLQYIDKNIDELINTNKFHRSSSRFNLICNELDIKKSNIDKDNDIEEGINNSEVYSNEDDRKILKNLNLDSDKLNILFNNNHNNLLNIEKIIDEKNIKLNLNKSILEIKYEKYKRCHNFWNISTILLSSLLTFIESCKLVFLEEADGSEEEHITNNYFVLSPIILGTIITGCSSITKFKKYQENMEAIYILIDKCIGMLTKFVNIKDEICIIKNNCIYLQNQKDIDEIDLSVEKINLINNIKVLHQKYKSDLNNDLLTVYQETERYINFNDYDRYLKIINQNDYKKHILTTDKKIFLKNYNEDFHENKMYNIHSDKSKPPKGTETPPNSINKHKRLNEIHKKSMKGREKAKLSCI